MSDLQVDSDNQSPPAKPGNLFGTIFLILFATPFAGFGLLALVQGIRKSIAGETKDGLIVCVFGLVFSTVGFGLMFGSVWARKNAKKTAELQARYAGKPWMMRADWAAGKIKSSAMAQPLVYLIMALGFCGIGGVSAGVSLPAELHKHNYAALLILIFPIIGFCFLVAFIKACLSRARYGACFLELAQVPIPLGGTLDGMIQVGGRLKLEHGLHLKFSCIRRVVSGSGKSRSVRESVLWQDEKIFKPEASLPEPEPGHTGIPIYFKLPDGQPQCFNQGDVSVFWRLEARAKMAGPDFSAAFEVPVFQVAGAVAGAADATDPTAALQMPIEEVRRDEHSKIRVSDGPGGREFFFPAARNIGAALFTSVFALILDAGAGATIYFHVMIVFPICLSLFGLLISCFAFSLWFKSSRVTINFTGVSIVTRYLFFSRARQFAASDVARFETRTGMTSGAQVYLDIRLIPRNDGDDFTANKEKYLQAGQLPSLRIRMSDPRGITVANAIPGAAEANWLAQEMNRALGRPA